MVAKRRVEEQPVLIVGGSGQIGWRLAEACRNRGWACVPTFYRNPQPGAVALDATDDKPVRRLIEQWRPWLIVNSLNAQGGTDACEADPTLAIRAHYDTVRHLVDAVVAVNARFIQISTDYVFDGQAGPYAETDPPHPLSQLGRAKLMAECYVMERLPEALVLRTSFVFSWAPHVSAKNFIMQLLDNDRAGRLMRVPNDQVGNVTYAPTFAEALVELVELGQQGLFHVAGTTRCSKYEWALKTAERFGLNRTLIHGVSTAELEQRGPRPLQSGFHLAKVQGVLRRTRLLSLDESLTEMEREMSLVRAEAA
ncbi:MAG: SDR family oxidoreductase [Candidatus Omnitrophica bacterium]|nr:SDR family oxidoreductase [Candidatus Omnitrophota bacterium]